MNLKDRLSWWYQKAQSEKDAWVRFILYWIIFDAYLSAGSGFDRDQERLNWFLKNNNELKTILIRVWDQNLPKSWINNLARLSIINPIQDMRPKKPDPPISIDNTRDLKQVIDVIYRIRCNLFHGAKNLNDPRDQDLVNLSGNLLKEAINEWLATSLYAP